jgi:hypothetical protein
MLYNEKLKFFRFKLMPLPINRDFQFTPHKNSPARLKSHNIKISLRIGHEHSYTESFDISPELRYIYFQLNHTAWHALVPFQLLITNVFRPFAYGIAPATSHWLGLVILLLMTWGSILLISMVICLPLCFPQQRPWVNDDIEETSASSL